MISERIDTEMVTIYIWLSFWHHCFALCPNSYYTSRSLIKSRLIKTNRFLIQLRVNPDLLLNYTRLMTDPGFIKPETSGPNVIVLSCGYCITMEKLTFTQPHRLPSSVIGSSSSGHQPHSFVHAFVRIVPSSHIGAIQTNRAQSLVLRAPAPASHWMCKLTLWTLFVSPPIRIVNNRISAIQNGIDCHTVEGRWLYPSAMKTSFFFFVL